MTKLSEQTFNLLSELLDDYINSYDNDDQCDEVHDAYEAIRELNKIQNGEV